MSANDTVVPLASCYPRIRSDTCRSVLPCSSIQLATSLLTKDACAPVPNKVEALYDGLFPIEIQHMRYLHRHRHMSSCSLETGGGDYSTSDRSYRCLHRHSHMSFCSLETGGGDYLAGGVDVELNPCSSGAIFLATPYMRDLSAASSALERSTWTVLPPVLSMRFFSCLLLDPSGYFFTVVQYFSTCDRSYRCLHRQSLMK